MTPHVKEAWAFRARVRLAGASPGEWDSDTLQDFRDAPGHRQGQLTSSGQPTILKLAQNKTFLLYSFPAIAVCLEEDVQNYDLCNYTAMYWR
ncbi:hypothetical protein KDA_33590 [Dictyobacter alpinus]|uniref:Uncharacterized protein n=1 Tax=Dictyobacter alpinus TaxID=2014873 RepID=A0A402B954_9CHLR|nr:hypothetical protein KDA_33590 [Dictyobacter alpinus]